MMKSFGALRPCGLSGEKLALGELFPPDRHKAERATRRDWGGLAARARQRQAAFARFQHSYFTPTHWPPHPFNDAKKKLDFNRRLL